MFKILDILRISLRQVFRARKKYFGVLLSIAFGTAGMLLILSLGDDVKDNLNQDLELLGGATVIKCTYDQSISASSMISKVMEFEPETAEALRNAPGVSSVSILTFAPGYSSVDDQEVSEYTLLGIDEYFWDVITVKAIAGRFFGAKEVEERQRVCVLGEVLATRIFGHADVVGKHLPISASLFEIVGVLGGTNARDRAENAYVPFTTINDRFTQLMPTKLYIRCTTWDDVEPVAKMIPEIVGQYQPAEGLRMDVRYGPLKQLKRVVFWVELFILFSIGATLVLGGFGIWNGMMTAIKARTREIGLKKAMGAEDFDILLQFLAESTFLSMGAALLGVLLGRGGIELGCYFLQTTPNDVVFVTYGGASIVFSMVLGIIAGFFPALRASRMQVVTAIRYE